MKLGLTIMGIKNIASKALALQTLSALLIAAPAASLAAPRDHDDRNGFGWNDRFSSSAAYARGFREGFRVGFRDGRSDAWSERRDDRRSLRKSDPRDAYERGFSV